MIRLSMRLQLNLAQKGNTFLFEKSHSTVNSAADNARNQKLPTMKMRTLAKATTMNFFRILGLTVRLPPNLKRRKETQKRLDSR
jgi:hypothetical protein